MVLLDLSTIGPWTIEAIAGTLAPKGVVVRSGAVTLGVKAAIAGTLAVYLDKDVAEDPGLRPVVDTMAASVLATSGTGNAKIIKLINNLMVGVNVAATAEAFALAEKAGLPAEILHPLIMKGSGASFALANQIADAIAGEVGVGRFGTTYILKDLRIAMEMAKRSRHTMLFGATGMAA